MTFPERMRVPGFFVPGVGSMQSQALVSSEKRRSLGAEDADSPGREEEESVYRAVHGPS